MKAPSRETALALGAYTLVAAAAFATQLRYATDGVAYVGDAVESVAIVAWNVHQFFRAPWRIFESNVFWPTPHALALTDHRLLPSLLVAPVVWATGNPVLATNVAIVLACLLAAMAARRLALLLVPDEIAAWAAGALYAFHTYQINEASRLNIIFHGFLPLAVERLLRLLITGERRYAWHMALLLLLQGLSSNYHLLYGVLLVSFVGALGLALRPRESVKALGALVVPGLLAALLFAPIAWPYLALAREHGYERPLPQSMGIEHFFTTLPTNLLFGPIGAALRTQQRGPHFLGFAALALALLALVTRRRRDGEPEGLLPLRVWVPSAALLALLLFALALGRNVVWQGHYLAPGPYQLLYRFFPGFQQVRIPERLSLLGMLFLALLVARGLALMRPRLPRMGLLALAALIPFEHLSPDPQVERLPVGRGVPEVYQFLRTSDARAVAELPIRGEDRVRDETLEMYFATVHWKPIIHGYTAYPPLVTRILRRAAATFPSEMALQAFARVGVDAVVVHHGRAVGRELERQMPGRGAERNERFERVLRSAGLDLYGQLSGAVESGRIVRAAFFEGPRARLYDSTRDEVFRIAPVQARPAAPFPVGKRLRGEGWSYAASAGADASLAADARIDTTWTIPDPLRGDEWFEVRFGAPVVVGGLALPMRWDTVYPTRFRVEGLSADGVFVPLARFDEPHLSQLLDRVLADPRTAAIGFELGGRELHGLRLIVESGGTSFEGWSIPEIEVLGPAG